MDFNDVPKRFQNDTKMYFEENDPLQTFIDEKLALDSSENMRAATLYNIYSDWADENHTKPKLSMTSFGQKIVKKGLKKEKMGKARTIYYLGVEEKTETANGEKFIPNKNNFRD